MATINGGKKKKDHEGEKRKGNKYYNQIFHENRKVYGSPRIQNELQKKEVFLFRKNSCTLYEGNWIIRVHWFHYTDNSNPIMIIIYPNLLKRNFKADAPNRIWVADITYIWTTEGWIYLATVMDLFSRKIVGWNIRNLTKGAPKLASGRALHFRSPQEGLIHHSDQGVRVRF